MFIKICGLSDPAALEAAIAAGVDAVGFVFAESPRRIEPAAAARLAAAVPPGVLTVAVMRHPTQAACDRVFADFEPDCLQTDVEDFASLRLPRGCTALPVCRDGGRHDAATLPHRLLYEGARSGSGLPADWDTARRLAADSELILAGGLNAENVAAAIAAVLPWGVDVSSGVEARPGVKDPRKILEFVSRVRELERLV